MNLMRMMRFVAVMLAALTLGRRLADLTGAAANVRAPLSVDQT